MNVPELPPSRPRMTLFWRAFLVTTGPFALACLVSAAGAFDQTYYYVWFYAAAAWLFAVMVGASGVIAVLKEREAQAGFFAGMAVSAALLMVSCFANVATVGPIFGTPGPVPTPRSTPSLTP